MSAIVVFLEGLLSFFSPCVLPLLPVYIGYLAGEEELQTQDQPAGTRTKKIKTAAHTFCFVLGIGTAFLILGMGLTSAGMLLRGNRIWFARIGGILVILMGLYQLGIFGKIRAVETEHRLPFRIRKLRMSPLTAYLTGFLFSFAWTPCVGPMLSSVLLMAGASATRASGMLLVLLYTLGFAVPFLLAGIFTSFLLDLFRKHHSVVRYTAKIGGALMVLMGILMILGKMDTISAALAAKGSAESAAQTAQQEEEPAIREEEPKEEPQAQEEANAPEEAEDAPKEVFPAPDFTLTDQYGNTHTLSDYQGKVVFLNFWATWCPPCRAEMPDIQKLYEEYSAEEDPEVVFLGVASPGIGGEEDAEGLA